MNARVITAVSRLGVSYADAERIANRDTDKCAALVRFLEREWGQATNGSCCKPKRTSENEYPMACEHLRRLWAARAYHELAVAGAPTDQPAFPCECNGSGTYYGHGYVENGVFKGKTGKCFRCGGKGWQDEADRKRNAYYDNHVRRVSA